MKGLTNRASGDNITIRRTQIIIANDIYDGAPVPYAINDGKIFREYCLNTLGMPENNVYFLENATLGMMVSVIEDLKKIANAYEEDASIILYYSGHGFPSDKNANAYLLPTDGVPSIEKTCISLSKLYEELGQLKTKQTIVFLDACFSGSKRENEMLLNSKGVVINVKPFEPIGNTIVFSASQGDETAHQFEEKRHGLFTYFLLKSLQESEGDIHLSEMSEYVIKQVKRTSVVVNNKMQTPTLTPSIDRKNDWQGIHF